MLVQGFIRINLYIHNNLTLTSITDSDSIIAEVAIDLPSLSNLPNSKTAVNLLILSSSKTANIRISIICTNCNKVMVLVVLKYLNKNPTALNRTQIQPTMI
ncbi:hypothetical protein GLOIN_2v1525371 [Rhizophagus clarus]|uniref:Uncharacterized protein n=1 Tax=Rhizophagus clarus TaxID=94130 RepID=A0A8H3KU31_9GLOM|nr:hypothetical protein GLOIN_2v1525371 [Rhizophagus clarus]